jgi:hypothetical protein
MKAQPMKEAELRERSTCVCCDKKLGQTGSPLFYKVSIERHMVNLGAVQRQSGLALSMGSAMLAQVMGPDENMTAVLDDVVTVTVCQMCACEPHWPLAAIVEKGTVDTVEEVPGE